MSPIELQRPLTARSGSGLCAALGCASWLLAFAPAAAGWVGPAAGGGEGARPIPADEVLERNGAVIGDILVRVEDVFNPELPGEDRRVYRVANRLHRNTRPEVIRSQLLFRSGDAYSGRVLRETERLLRTHKYLFDCSIRPLRYEDNRVDVEVWVKDVWTLKAAASFGRGGGANERSLEVQDRNFLGTGRTVALEWEDTVDRTSVTAQFLDRNLLGRWVELEALYADNSDGEKVQLDLLRPFVSLDSRWAAGLSVRGDDRVDTLYALGEPVERFLHRQDQIEVFGGLSRGLQAARTRRWLAGITYERDSFAGLPDERPALALPDDRRRIYPWVGFESVSDTFDTTTNQDQLGRTEDLLLGRRHRLRLGFASSALGSDRDQAVFRASTEFGVRPVPKLTLLGSAAALGRWDGDGFEDLLALAETRLYRRARGGHLFFAELQLAAARRLDGREVPRVHRVGGEKRPFRQLLLGGDSGLRGYPLRYQDGDERALLTVEQRFFTGWHPLRLVFVGAAVFFDLGRTWPGEDSAPNLGWLSDVGFGLRLSPSRSGFGSVVHLDVAFPLGGERSIRSVQWLVTSKQSL